jgi:hypothetical protein
MIHLDVRIPHLPTEERRESLRRMLTGFGGLPIERSRWQLAFEASRWGRPDRRATITVHPDPERTGERNVWGCWTADLGDSSHRLVLEDDMVPCRDFLHTVLACLEARPDLPLALFAGRSRLSVVAHAKGYRWAWWRRFLSGGAMLLPREDVEDLVAHPTHEPGTITTDRLVNEWLDSRRPGRGVHYVVPCFLDHDVSIGSAIGNRSSFPPRSALWYDDASPLREDWTDSRTFVAEVGDVGMLTVDHAAHETDPLGALREAAEKARAEVA